MNPSKWEKLVFLAEENFGIDKKEKQEIEVDELSNGEKIMGEEEIIEFKSPLGKIRIEKISRPKVVDKKVLRAKRIGSNAVVDYVYSPDEKTVEMKIFKQAEDGEWQEISPEKMGFN